MLKKFSLSKLIVHLCFIIVCFLMLVPFLIIIFSSLQSKEGFLKYGYVLFPQEIDFSAYLHIFKSPEQLLNSYGVTIFITAVGTILGMFIMTTMAYVISRDDYPYKRQLSFFIYFTMLFSGGMVGHYIWFAQYLHLTNKIWALILPLLCTPFNIFILRTSCKAIPFSLIESAKLEGASEFWIFVKVIVPLAKTGIATISLLMIFAFWNSWFNSMLYIHNNSYVTLQYYLVQMLENAKAQMENMDAASSMSISEESFRMAICTLATLPMLFVFSFLQKYFVKGVTVGSVKG